MNGFSRDKFLRFLLRSRHEIYVKEKYPTTINVPNFSSNAFQNGDCQLTILESGIDFTTYTEMGYYNKVPVWLLMYRGRFLLENETEHRTPINLYIYLVNLLDFLKTSVGQNTDPQHIRGPENYPQDSMKYECDQSSERHVISGTERIFVPDHLIYTARFQALWLIND
jgi:hypothetical protein